MNNIFKILLLSILYRKKDFFYHRSIIIYHLFLIIYFDSLFLVIVSVQWCLNVFFNVTFSDATRRITQSIQNTKFEI